jgi:hypothetical protein
MMTLAVSQCHYQGDVGSDVMSLLSIAGNGTTEDDVGHGVMSLSSHTGNGITEVTLAMT